MAKTENNTDDERRRYARFVGEGLVAQVDGRILPVVDVSLGGVRVGAATGPAATGPAATGVTELRMIPCDGEVMRLGAAADGRAQILGGDKTGSRLAFVGVSVPLVRLIGEHIRRQGGSRPLWKL